MVVVQKLSTRIDGRPFISRSRDDVYRNILFTLEKHLNDERTTIADEKHPQQLHQTAKIVEPSKTKVLTYYFAEIYFGSTYKA
jgi:hypothetical protein